MWHSSFTNQPPTGHTKLTYPGREGCVEGGNNIPDPGLLLTGALDSQQTPFNGTRRPLGHTGILSAPLVWCSPPSRPYPHPILWPLRWVGIWGRPPGPTLWFLYESRHHALLLLLFFLIHVIGWSGGCFNPGFIPGVSLWLLICNMPLGNEPLPDWHPESASRLWLCM